MAQSVILRLAIVCALWWCPDAQSQDAPETHYDFPLTITHEDTSHTFNIEIATTRSHKAKGLMFRRHMLDDQGMLFDYTDKPAKIITMWMKNTHIPLDILFLSPEGDILSIASNTTPFSLKPISSHVAASAVLELNARIAEKLSIAIGDRVSADIFK